LRVLGVAAAAIVAGLLLKVLPAFVVLLLFVGGIAYVNLTLRNRVRSAMPRGAEVLGLRREASDPFGLLGYPLALFDRMPEASIDELVWGSWRGLDVRVFGVSFRAPSLGSETPRTSFGCALAHVAAELPPLVLEPQVFLTTLDRPPDAPRWTSGDGSFDDRLHAWTGDPAFASQVATPEMRELLRSFDPQWGVEVAGRIAIVYGPAPQRPDVVAILEGLQAFLATIPREVLTAHPPAAT
jgi:hypothetical protein